jgi:hypothetical protein
LAIHRLRLIIATLAALLVPAALAGPALAAHVRVEGKAHSIFQGNARPIVGTLQGHTTTKRTALGALVKASRKQPFALRLTWSDCCGGGWSGLFVASINNVTPPATRVRVNGVPHAVNANGTVTLRFARGTSSVRAVEPGAIRSQRLWVHAS